MDKIAVLDAGADDYRTKPFGVGGAWIGHALYFLTRHPARPLDVASKILGVAGSDSRAAQMS